MVFIKQSCFSIKDYLSLFVLFFLSQNLFSQFVSGNSYFSSYNYIESIAGDLPIILVSPHAGDMSSDSMLDISTANSDNGTFELAQLLENKTPERTGVSYPIHKNKIISA
jgi:hypothetical protein